MHVIDSGGLYGAERVLLELAARCRSQGHRVIVAPLVAPQDRADPLGEAAQRAGLETIRFLLPDGLRLGRFRSVLEAARAEGVDIIHSHGYKANILLALSGTRRSRPPVLSTLHGWTAPSRVSRKGIYECLERALLGRLDRVVAVSPTIKARVPRLAGRDAVQVIPNGIALTEKPGEVDPRVQAMAAEGPAILAAGRLSPEKGFDLLIEAMSWVVRRVPRARLVIAGEGPQRRHLESLIKWRKLQHHVLLPGYVPRVRSAMKLFDLYALSSRTEGLPAVVLEAMAEGLPVVATRVGALPEVLDDGGCGRLVPPEDGGALAATLCDLLQHARQRRKLREAARARCMAHYSSASMVRAYRGLYQALCGAKAAALQECT